MSNEMKGVSGQIGIKLSLVEIMERPAHDHQWQKVRVPFYWEGEEIPSVVVQVCLCGEARRDADYDV